jgi:hypothetical protein
MTTANRILAYVRTNTDPRSRCIATVATALSSDFRGFKHTERCARKLVRDGLLTCANVDNWAECLSIPDAQQEASQ